MEGQVRWRGLREGKIREKGLKREGLKKEEFGREGSIRDMVEQFDSDIYE